MYSSFPRKPQYGSISYCGGISMILRCNLPFHVHETTVHVTIVRDMENEHCNCVSLSKEIFKNTKCILSFHVRYITEMNQKFVNHVVFLSTWHIMQNFLNQKSVNYYRYVSKIIILMLPLSLILHQWFCIDDSAWWFCHFLLYIQPVSLC